MPKLPELTPGRWQGEVVGGASIHFGQTVQPGPPRQSVEFSYCLLPVALAMLENTFTWPGVLMLMAPTPMKASSSEAGVLMRPDILPSLTLSLDATREQFSDMLRYIEARRLKLFHFTTEEERGAGRWPIQTWGITVSPTIPSQDKCGPIID